MENTTFKTGRIEAISDGVFAIAMTLLVLELKLPELEEPVTKEVFINALLAQAPHFISWVISFAILCRLWITQHALLGLGEKKTRLFTTLNFIFLGTVSFISFPTSLISEHSDQTLSVIIFSAVLIVAGLTLGFMWLSLDKKERKIDVKSDVNRALKRVIILMPVIGVVSCLLAILNPRIGSLFWIVFPFSGIIIKRRRAHSND